jgi:serine/threonine-protein kinase RsbW
MANATTVVKADTIGGPATSTRNRVRTVAFTFEFSLPSKVAAVSPLIEEFMQLIAHCSGVSGSETAIEIALGEAVVNAVVHGDHEDPRRHVHVDCRCEPDEISILVRDEGQGFDVDRVLDPTAPENILSTHGRGIYLMRAYMDEVRFEEGGRAVQMRKRAPSAETRIQGRSEMLCDLISKTI